MKKKFFKDYNIRLKFKKKEVSYFFIKSILFNQYLTFEMRYKFIFRLIKIKKFSKTKMQNRCLLTYRAQSVYRHCKLTRIKFREFSNLSLLNGIKTSS